MYIKKIKIFIWNSYEYVGEILDIFLFSFYIFLYFLSNKAIFIFWDWGGDNNLVFFCSTSCLTLYYKAEYAGDGLPGKWSQTYLKEEDQIKV